MEQTRNLRRSLRSSPDMSALNDEKDKTMKELFSLEDKLQHERFNVNLTKEMHGKDLDMDYIRNCGFKEPLIFRQPDGLNITMPNKVDFSVNQISNLVGKNKVIFVQNCEDQSTIQLTLAKFCQYFNSKNRKKVYNVLSLEFSNTKLAQLVHRPSVIDEFDWIDSFFPIDLKDELGCSYPKIRKYCLMSAADSYTTFHIDFGGTSVWYHVLKGTKIFWLIEPTEENLRMFEQWSIGDVADDVFFGDLVEKCQRVTLNAGNTFMMPSGWIHAVYTPEDSIVFGGNFVHGFAVEMQLKISEMERRLKTPAAQRFPLERNLQFFVIEDYVYSKTGKSFLVDNCKRSDKMETEEKNLSSIEINGFVKLVEHLKSYLDEPVEGIINVKDLWKSAVDMLGLSDKYSHITLKSTALSSISSSKVNIMKGSSAKRKMDHPNKSSSVTCKKQKPSQPASQNTKARKSRCRVCVKCMSDECRKCKNCLDKPKYGGRNVLKQACLHRKCLYL